DRFIEELAERNIGTSVHFIPIHLHPYYRDRYGFTPASFPVACSNYQRLLSLPLNPALTDQDVSDVIEGVLDVLRNHRVCVRSASSTSWFRLWRWLSLRRYLTCAAWA